MRMPKRPGGELTARPLHFIWIADCSGSMGIDGKIQALNHAIREAIPHTQQVAAENPYARVFMRAVAFSKGARWHISKGVPIEQFQWHDLEAGGTTDMGKALELVATEMKVPPMVERALPPVLVLISDGRPTDDFESGLNKLLSQPWGSKAVRIAIAIGEDADHSVLQQFIFNDELKPLQANNPESLINYIRWVSTAVLRSVSDPMSSAGNQRPALPSHTSTIILTGPVTKDVW